MFVSVITMYFAGEGIHPQPIHFNGNRITMVYNSIV